MMEWKPMNTAPRDGTWILLEGEFAGGDTSIVIMARWEPHQCETGVYEWRTLMPNNPRPVRHNLPGFEVALIALSFAIGLGFAGYALLLFRKGDDGGAFLANGYIAGAGLIGGIISLSVYGFI